MIRVTTAAAVELRALLRYHRTPPGQALRLAPNGKNGISMTVTAPRVGDEVIQDGPDLILIVEPALASRLDGLIFDFVRVVTEDQGASIGFQLRAPRADEATP